MKTLILIVMLITLGLSACSSVPQGKPDTLIAVKVRQVTLDAAAAEWTKAPELVVLTKEVARQSAPPGPTLRLRALYDEQSIAIRVEWPDASQSIYKNAWTWDGTTFSKSGDDEDRLMFHFPMTNDPGFSSKGCAAICHNQDDSPERWYMAADSPEFRYDQWHWKSTRTNPIGQADDKWLGVQKNRADTESAHYADAQEGGGESRNQNERGNGPAFINGIDANSPYILAGQEVPLEMTTLQAGTLIPGYILSPLLGSRGDVRARGIWEDGVWVVVLLRALNTGHEDDVAFTPPKPLPFGLAVIDNGGGYDHAVVENVLTLEWK
jgi:hypothetical protein